MHSPPSEMSSKLKLGSLAPKTLCDARQPQTLFPKSFSGAICQFRDTPLHRDTPHYLPTQSDTPLPPERLFLDWLTVLWDHSAGLPGGQPPTPSPRPPRGHASQWTAGSQVVSYPGSDGREGPNTTSLLPFIPGDGRADGLTDRQTDV